MKCKNYVKLYIAVFLLTVICSAMLNFLTAGPGPSLSEQAIFAFIFPCIFTIGVVLIKWTAE
jgi:ABC-type Mn2+/Zn2+ transport system permease subunit